MALLCTSGHVRKHWAYLAAAVEQLRAKGTDIPDEYLTHLSPLAWEHINLLGQYTFDASAARPLDRPWALRNGFEDDAKYRSP